MSYNDTNYEWTKKGGTLSDKTAFEEFGLTQNDIMKAINEGKLQFREGSIYGNPYFRLLRSEVEKLASERFGKDLFNKKKAKNELKSKIAGLEIRKNELTQIIKA